MKEGIWYRKTGQEWAEALPLGNGRLGAMVYGGETHFRMQVDESTFWSGGPSGSNDREGMPERIKKVREALSNRDYETADCLGRELTGNRNQYGTSLPVGELTICMRGESVPPDNSYRRELDFETGTYQEFFSVNGQPFERTVFVSNPAQIVVIHMKTPGEGRKDWAIRFDGIYPSAGINITAGQEEAFAGSRSEQQAAEYRVAGDAYEPMHSDGKTGVHLEGSIVIRCNGRQRLADSEIILEKASDITVYMDLGTTMFDPDPRDTCQRHTRDACGRGFEALRREHSEDVGRLYKRMAFSLGDSEKRCIPTDERLERMRKGERDHDLFALMFQYGRYLLIASSRENSPLPTHMGGIWNDDFYTKMDCGQDMHLDMNLQMQYWGSAMCGLPECYGPFLNYVEEVLVPSGTVTARKTYGAKGWAAHVVSNPWGFTSLGWGYHWGVWAMGGIWCATLLWDYYLYTMDEAYLKDRGMPVIEGAAQFAADYVFWDEAKGCYAAGPSYSPENQFRVEGKNYYLDTACTCDMILIKEIFQIYREASKRTGRMDAELLRKIQKIEKNFPDFQIGGNGQLQEWFYDYEEAIPNHRHSSHLLGVYPFSQIGPEDKRLADAVRTSIKRRMENLEKTSWCMNMFMGYYVRLKNSREAYGILTDIFQCLVRENMTSVMSPINDDTSIWGSNWELDGNTGLTAVIAEMLVQSDGHRVKLLPALPEEWAEGSLTGIRIKGGHEGSVSWENGKLTEFILNGGRNENLIIEYEDSRMELEVKKDQIYSVKKDSFIG